MADWGFSVDLRRQPRLRQGDEQAGHQFAESLISSIGRLHIALLSFALIYILIGLNLYSHNEALRRLGTLDDLLTLNSLVNSISTKVGIVQRPAQLKDLPHFFTGAAVESFDEQNKRGLKLDKEFDEAEQAAKPPEESEKQIPTKFTTEEIPGAT